jgi:hypothetical protein
MGRGSFVAAVCSLAFAACGRLEFQVQPPGPSAFTLDPSSTRPFSDPTVTLRYSCTPGDTLDLREKETRDRPFLEVNVVFTHGLHVVLDHDYMLSADHAGFRGDNAVSAPEVSVFVAAWEEMNWGAAHHSAVGEDAWYAVSAEPPALASATVRVLSLEPHVSARLDLVFEDGTTLRGTVTEYHEEFGECILR